MHQSCSSSELGEICSQTFAWNVLTRIILLWRICLGPKKTATAMSHHSSAESRGKLPSFPFLKYGSPSLCSKLLREWDDPHLLAKEEEDVNNYPYLCLNEDKRREIEESSGTTISPDLCSIETGRISVGNIVRLEFGRDSE